jgi:serine/threonine protein kinase
MHAGYRAPLSFTLGYAAPEVAFALEQGCDTIVADCPMDAWAIGVIAFELLTGRPAFKMFRGKQDVRHILAPAHF